MGVVARTRTHVFSCTRLRASAGRSAPSKDRQRAQRVTNGQSKKLDVDRRWRRQRSRASSVRQRSLDRAARSKGRPWWSWSPAVLPAWLAQVEPLEGGREKEDGGDWRLARRRIVWLPACASAGTTSAVVHKATKAAQRASEAEASTAASASACMHARPRAPRQAL